MAKTRMYAPLLCSRISVFFVCMGLCAVCSLASEDSVEDVLKGYESPQKLFMQNIQDSKNKPSLTEGINKKSTDSKQTAFSKTKGLHGLKSTSTKPPPQWIYSTAILEINFSDGSYKRGLGTLLENGYYLTSSEIIYNGKVVPKRVYAKMQDDLNAQIICVTALNVKVVDLDAGLALLEPSFAVDGYCQKQEISYYQDRIYKRFGIDVFASSKKISTKVKANYPYLDAQFIFVPQSTRFEKVATYYNFDKRKEQVYGFEIKDDSYEEFTYGKAFYDDNGVFLGIMSRSGTSYLPVFIHRDVVQDFLCFARDNKVVEDRYIEQKCRLLGNARKRFFTDMKGRANFY